MHTWLVRCEDCKELCDEYTVKYGKCSFCRLAERPKPW